LGIIRTKSSSCNHNRLPKPADPPRPTVKELVII
jgi:hypothetical protein